MTIPRILIVDDDPALLDALPETLRLRMEPVTVDVAESGAAALNRIQAADYDAIIADIRMPGMDGLKLLSEIRALRPDTPTLLITGHGEHELAIEALRRGAYDYIQKPIDREYFVASLHRAIEMRRLARQVEQQRRTLERHSEELEQQVRALTEVAAAIHQARGVEEVLEAVAAAGTRLVGGTVFAAMARYRDGQGPSPRGNSDRRWEATSSPPDALAHVETLQVKALFELAAEGRRIVRADEVQGVGGGSVPAIGSYLAAPILDRGGTVLGAIYLGHTEPRRFTPDLQRQIEALTRQAAVAMENALHYQRQRGIAETLQFSLLPEQLPTIPGVTMAARYLPGPTEAVGGDWYDVFPLPGGRIGIVMGDVAGRGVEAAALMGQLRNALRAYALEGHSPMTVGRQLRRLLEPGQMATVIYGVFEPQNWSLQFINLGHPPPVVISPGQEPIFLYGGSPPLGADMWAAVSEERARLGPGSTLFVYTDGLLEVRGESLDDGLARLRRALTKLPDGDPDLDVLIGSIVEDVVRGRTVEDDVALLAVRAAPLDPHRLSLRLAADAASSPLLRHALSRWLELHAATPEEIYEITVATSEAFGNAVEHAYGPKDATVDVEAVADQGTVEVIVRDTGKWRAPRGEHRGRGIDMMRGLMDGLELIRAPEGTTVRMRRRLKQTRSEVRA